MKKKRVKTKVVILTDYDTMRESENDRVSAISASSSIDACFIERWTVEDSVNELPKILQENSLDGWSIKSISHGTKGFKRHPATFEPIMHCAICYSTVIFERDL